MKLEPRDYQIKARQLVADSIRSGNKRIILKMPTGTGKTEMAVLLSDGALKKCKKVAFSASYSVLINQTVERFEKYGIESVGVMMADHELTDNTQPIQVCSHQTLARRKFPDADLVFIDECHLQFKVVYDWMEACPDAIFIGLTATPFSKGLGLHWQDCISIKSLRENINDGTLCDYKAFGVALPDTSDIGTGADGDLKQTQLAEVMGEAVIVDGCIERWLSDANGTQTIVFAVNVKHANFITNEFARAGARAQVITGKTPQDERKILFDKFASREITILVSVGVLIAGFDGYVETLILATKTKSRIKLIQMIGRGLRVAEGKDHLVVFDFGGSLSVLGYPEDIDEDFVGLDTSNKNATSPDTKPQEKIEKLPKICPSKDCDALKPPGVHECPECGFAPRHGENVEVAEHVQIEELRRAREEKSKSKDEKYSKEYKQDFYSGLLYMYKQARMNGKQWKDTWVAAKYRSKFGVWPKGLKSEAAPPNSEVTGFCRSQNIAYAKSKKAV